MPKIGSNIIRVSRTDSTNKLAWRMIAESPLPEGTLISADYQTHGRGQGENNWESADGQNICVSLILYPHWLPPAEQFSLNKAVSLAVRATIEELLTGTGIDGPQLRIKWPNDIYIGLEKVAGILIENSLSGNRFETSVIGIGINLNQNSFHSDAPNPVSVSRYTPGPVSRNGAIDILGRQLDFFMDMLKHQGQKEVQRIYLKHLLGINKKTGFFSDKDYFEAIIRGTDAYGRLMLELPGNVIRYFDMREVRMAIKDDLVSGG